MPIVRYPGGNFVSGYNWLDGVGPKAQRPVVLDRAWNSIETNQFGTNEFIEWCGMVGAEPLLGMNFGTGTVESAVAYVEYCNLDRGTRWSELRRAHGYDRPHNVRHWCLGNEMDGPWQIGQLQAREYGRKARDAAQQMRVIDPNLQLIACGSSGTFMPTYLTWDREVLEECYDKVDGISLHAYYGNTAEWSGNSTARFLAMNLDMDRHIHEIAAVCDYVQGLQKSSKRLWLSFDEWNVWYRARERPVHQRPPDGRAAPARGGLQPRGRAARRRLRQHAAAQFGSRAGRLPRAARQRDRAARDERERRAPPEHLLSLQLGAPLRARPCARSPRRVRHLSDQARPACRPISRATRTCRSSTWSPPSMKSAGQAAVLMLNRDLDAARDIVLEWDDVVPTRVLACETLTGPDLKAVNTFADPRRVAPQRLDPPAAGARMTFNLPPRSYTVAHLGTRA